MAGASFDPGPSAFDDLLRRWNALDAAGFAAWEFLPGSRFGELAAWWRGDAARDVPHEGLDIRWFRARDGRLLQLGPGTRVPAPWAGEVVAIVPDFLGRSVFVAHARRDAAGRRLHTVCGHVDPAPGLVPGSRIGEGDELGTIADPSGRRTIVPPHLHLTIALVAGAAPLDWDAVRDAGRVLLLDPLPILGGRCGTMPPIDDRQARG